jgi:hypothetical protein
VVGAAGAALAGTALVARGARVRVVAVAFTDDSFG